MPFKTAYCRGKPIRLLLLVNGGKILFMILHVEKKTNCAFFAGFREFPLIHPH